MRLLAKSRTTISPDSTNRQMELEGILNAIDGSQAIIEFKPDGTILTANSNFLSTMGYTLQEIEGEHHRMFMAAEDQASAEYANLWKSLRSGEFYTDQVSRINKAGEQIWLQASYCPILDASNEVAKVVKFATDITDRRLKEADAEGQINAIHRAQAVIEFDMQGHVLTANSNFLDVVGYSLDEVVGKHHSLFVHSDDSSTLDYQKLWQDLRNGTFVTVCCRRIAKGGGEVWLQSTYNPILDPNGRPHKVVKFATDVTDQKEAEGNLHSLINEATQVMSALRDGDLTQSLEGDYSPELQVLADSINQSVSQLGALMSKMNTNAHTILRATTELNQLYSESRLAVHKSADQTLQIAEAAKGISGKVSKVVSSMAEMTSSVEQVSSNSTEAAKVAHRAVSLADSAKINVNQLADSSNDIGAVIKVINSIADQTNLLALNATIEAARAGEAGKGFAVVANEVKELAKETAKATEEVSIKISAIQNDSQVAVKAINDIGSTIENISQTQSSIAKNVDSQSTVTQEIKHAFNEVSEDSNGIEVTISDATLAASKNQQRADNSLATTSELSELADQLVDLVSQFKVTAT